jgi:hypothetical protein
MTRVILLQLVEILVVIAASSATPGSDIDGPVRHAGAFRRAIFNTKHMVLIARIPGSPISRECDNTD